MLPLSIKDKKLCSAILVGNGDDDINTSELIEDLEHQVRLLNNRLQETEDKSAEMDLQMSSLLSSSGKL